MEEFYTNKEILARRVLAVLNCGEFLIAILRIVLIFFITDDFRKVVTSLGMLYALFIGGSGIATSFANRSDTKGDVLLSFGNMVYIVLDISNLVYLLDYFNKDGFYCSPSTKRCARRYYKDTIFNTYNFFEEPLCIFYGLALLCEFVRMFIMLYFVGPKRVNRTMPLHNDRPTLTRSEFQMPQNPNFLTVRPHFRPQFPMP